MGWIPYIERVDDLAPPFGVFVETRDYISEAIYSILSNDFEVAVLVGARIYPNLLPETGPPVVATNLVKNSTFDDDSEWISGDGWLIAFGLAGWKEVDGTESLDQTISGIIAGHSYQVIFTVSTVTNCQGIQPKIGGTLGTLRTETGSYSEILVGVNTDGIELIPVLSDAGIGNIVLDDVYVYDLSTATLPAITYQELTALRQYVLTGPVGMARFRFQINCWALTYAGVDGLSIEVRKALDGYSGTVENQYLHFVELIDEADMLENIAGLDVIKKYGKRLDFYIWSNELTD